MQKILPVLLSLILAPALYADWIELKDGTRLEGTISSVTPTSVSIETQTSPTIREEKTIARSDIANFQRASEDDLVFAEISAINLPDTADSSEIFESVLGKNVRKFMTDYPYSKHMPAARKLLATIDAEKARADAGEIKIDGQWITADKSKDATGEFDARIMLSKMKQANDPIVALNIFTDFEKKHNNTSSYVEAIRQALSNIKALNTQIPRFRADMEFRKKQQENGLALAGPEQRALLQQGIDQENARIVAAVDIARKNNQKWLPIVADTKTLDDIERVINSENPRLTAINISAMESGSAAAREAETQIESGELEVARESIAQAEKLWPQYVRLPIIKDSLKNAEAAAAAADKQAAQQAAPAK